MVLDKRNSSVVAGLVRFICIPPKTDIGRTTTNSGWLKNNPIERFNEYDSLDRIIFCRQLSGNDETHIKYYYNTKNDVIKIVQTSPQKPDSFVTLNDYSYNKKGLPTEMKIKEIIGVDTTNYTIKYDYDKANNISVVWTFTGDGQLIQKQTYDITPKSKKILEFSTEIKLPNESYTKGWNFYNFNAELSKTQYSNNTWTDFIYLENGLLSEALSYNMLGKLNSWKRYNYEFYEGGN